MPLNDLVERLALKDLAVVYGADERAHAVGAVYNPLGLAAWVNTAGMALVIVSKRYVLVGPLVARAVRVRGIFRQEQREDFYESASDVPSTRGFLLQCLSLLVKGRPFEGIDQALIFRPRERGEEFYLVRGVG
jgi:hypothetical protein